MLDDLQTEEALALLRAAVYQNGGEVLRGLVVIDGVRVFADSNQEGAAGKRSITGLAVVRRPQDGHEWNRRISLRVQIEMTHTTGGNVHEFAANISEVTVPTSLDMQILASVAATAAG